MPWQAGKSRVNPNTVVAHGKSDVAHSCSIAEPGGGDVCRQPEHRVSEGAKAGDIGRKGQLLYFIAWEGYSADASTWEPASNVGKELIEEYQASLREEAEADGAADAELESDEEGEADEEPESADTAEDMQI